MNTKTHVIYYLTTGRARRLPTGVYDVIVDVFDDHAETDTLGAKHVKVAGAAKLTFDARKGRRVKAALRPAPPAGYQQHFLMSLCLADSPATVMGWTIGNRLYVIPSSLPTVEPAYSSIWDPSDPESHGARYLAAAVHKKGLPSGLTATFHQSAMTTIGVTARSGPESGAPRITLSGDSGDMCRSGVLRLGTEATLPYSYAAHVSPGSWSVTEEGADLSFGPSRQYSGTGAGTRSSSRPVAIRAGPRCRRVCSPRDRRSPCASSPTRRRSGRSGRT